MGVFMNSRIIFVVIFISRHLISGAQLVSTPGTKIWNAINNLTDPARWKEGKLPDSCDRAIIPEKAAISVFLQDSFIIREIILPVDGDVVLGSGANITFENLSFKCRNGKDSYFEPPKSLEWYDPDVWNVALDETSKSPVPVPETERVPCFHDDVVFPFNSSYYASITGRPVHINSLTVAGKNLTSSEFEKLLTTPSGKLHFFQAAESAVTIHNISCTEKGGCPCGNDNSDVIDLICGLADCKELTCADPLKPIGSCCPVCGSQLTISFNSDFEFVRLEKLFSSYTAKPEYETIKGYLSRTAADKVQAIFVDNTESHLASSLTGSIQNYLLKDMNEVNAYGIVSVSSKSSSAWFSHGLSGRGLSGGQMMGVVALFMLFVYLAFGIAVVYKKYGLERMTFGLFAVRLHSRLHEEKDDSSDDEQQVSSFPPTSETKAGFENPMYEVKGTESEKPFYVSSVVEEKGAVSTEMRENPAFMIFDDVEDVQQESLLK